MAGILKNLEVTIRNVHIRYEDKQKPNSARHSFSSGATLKSVTMRTTSNLEEGTSAKLMVITKSLKTTVYKKKETQQKNIRIMVLFSPTIFTK